MPIRSTDGQEAYNDICNALAEQAEDIASNGYGSVENFFHVVGLASKKRLFDDALNSARPVSYGQCRTFCAGFLANYHGFGEQSVTALASLTYDSLPWRAEHLLQAAE